MLGRIYAIEHKTLPITYIGSTLKALEARWYEHTSGRYGTTRIHQYFIKYGYHQFRIRHIKSYQVVDLEHLHAWEQLWINKTVCVNVYCCFEIDFLASQFYHRLAYPYVRTYSWVKSVQCKIRRQLYRRCECGLRVRYYNLKKHRATANHKKKVNRMIKYICTL